MMQIRIVAVPAGGKDAPKHDLSLYRQLEDLRTWFML